MPRGNITTINELLKAFVFDPEESNSGRLARFLDIAARELPKTFISKRICAKVAFMQKRTPGEESDWVKNKLPKAVNHMRKVLRRDYNRDFYRERVEGGLRATVDSDDIMGTTYRDKQRRVVSAILSLQSTDDLVDARKVHGDLKKELIRSRKEQKHLEEYREATPLLPPIRD